MSLQNKEALAHYAVKDKVAVMAVLSSLVHDPPLALDERYPLSTNDFPERFHRVIFAAIEGLVKNGVRELNPPIIDDHISKYPNQYAIFEVNNGMEYLEQASALFYSKENFDHNYQIVKKCSLLSMLDTQGYDIKPFYNPYATEPGDVDKARKMFDDSTLEDIIGHYENGLAMIKNDFRCDAVSRSVQAGVGMGALKEHLKDSPEIGMPLNSGKLNTIFRGRRLKKFYFKISPTGTGKSASNSTRIPTYDQGWKTVGDIKVGDLLIDRHGKPTKVLAVYPQPEKKQVYRVYFDDGRYIDCCENHLWTYYKDRHMNTGFRTESTKEILQRFCGEWRESRKENPNGGSYRCRLPLCEAVEYPEKAYSVPPYVMGLLLGDASFRYQDDQKMLYYSAPDHELPTQIAKTMGWYCIKLHDSNYSYGFKHVEPVYSGKRGHENVWVEDVLADYPELWNCKSGDKFIPEDYLLGSVEQRMDLLRGLLDTDGSISCAKKGRVSFTTTSPCLKDGMVELAQSLGFRATVSNDGRDKYLSGVCFGVHIQCPRAMKPQLFSYTPKRKIAEEYAKQNSRENAVTYLAITDIEILDQYEDMTCFTVDNPEQLYLVGDYVVTHNTRFSAADAALLAIPERWDTERKEWVKTGLCEPTLFISTELEVDEVQTLFMAYTAAVPEDHILDGVYSSPDEEARVDYAIKILESSPLYIEYMPDFNIDDIENVVKKHKRQHQIGYVFFDYLATSIKLLMEIASKTRGVNLREDNVLVMFSTRLSFLAKKLNIHIDTSAQANGEWKTMKDPDQNITRGAKGISDKVDVGYCTLPPTNNDMTAFKQIVSSQGLAFLKEPNVVLHIYKVRRGKVNGVKVFQHFDYGTLRTTDLLVTDKNYIPVDVDSTAIEIVSGDEDETAPQSNEAPEVSERFDSGPIETDAPWEEWHTKEEAPPVASGFMI